MQNIMEEEWKEIRDYEGLYQISNKGNVKSIERWIDKEYRGKRWQEEKILKQRLFNRGYLYVGLWKNGKQKYFSVHRLVAQAFIPNPNNYPCVNHKDENKQSNNVENLEWCNAKYNNNYGTRLERILKKTTNGKLSKPVLQIDKNTNEIIKEFPSIKEVQRQLGFNQPDISRCCNGKQKQSYGYKWQFKSTT